MLFVSVLLHELGHSLVAKQYGIVVPRITLFVFGGVSEIATEPRSPRGVLDCNLGPDRQFCAGAHLLGTAAIPRPCRTLAGIGKYLAILNFVLGVFNLIPGLPLDGGRILRSILWRSTGNFRRASTIAAVTGRAFGFR